ncbi:hypothetical protein AOX55_00005935 (plasmid) [Sinorhizobium fredii CCBAU 25509]|nr:hypothetical protein AOX55_00005935 [Sinorhizobium fredii CCBAU 25509]
MIQTRSSTSTWHSPKITRTSSVLSASAMAIGTAYVIDSHHPEWHRGLEPRISNLRGH